MTDIIDKDGITVKTKQEIIDSLSQAFRNIFGDDISIESDTPDGQMIGIYAEASVDLRELIVEGVGSIDPNQAEGRALDQRMSINGLKRKRGTFTQINIAVRVSMAVNLTGLDGNKESLEVGEAFGVQDEEGNKFYLLQSVSIAGEGSYLYPFRAEKLGAVIVLPNTLTIPVTVIRGVASVNNTESPLNIGDDEESDFDLRRRKERTYSITGQGFIDNITSAVNAVNGVTSVQVYENIEEFEDAFGVPAHGVWCIVEGGWMKK
jgi:uncharacterized phage protein gp47/JayE